MKITFDYYIWGKYQGTLRVEQRGNFFVADDGTEFYLKPAIGIRHYARLCVRRWIEPCECRERRQGNLWADLARELEFELVIAA